MRIHHLVAAVAMLSLAGLDLALAGPAEDFHAAYAKAEAASKQAAAMKTQWAPTVAALNAAKKAGDAGKYDEAIALARHAEELANASLAQAKEQAAEWTQAVIR
jgi:hypothetical protein